MNQNPVFKATAVGPGILYISTHSGSARLMIAEISLRDLLSPATRGDRSYKHRRHYPIFSLPPT
jgi:hypothetical protein